MADLIGDLAAPYALIMRRGRAIGTIVPDCVVEENHSDQLVITEHPVESGAAISDHAFRRPAEVEMRVGFSDSSRGSVGWAQEAYDELLALQAERQPFDVSTGKRNYTNMLIAGLVVSTDAKSEYALNVIVSLRQIIITSTQSGGQVPNSEQAAPQATGSVQPGGTRRAVDAGTVLIPGLA